MSLACWAKTLIWTGLPDCDALGDDVSFEGFDDGEVSPLLEHAARTKLNINMKIIALTDLLFNCIRSLFELISLLIG
jgi:hypothetical protein